MSIFSTLLDPQPPKYTVFLNEQNYVIKGKNTSSNIPSPTSQTSSSSNSSNSSPTTPRRKLTFLDLLPPKTTEKSSSECVEDDMETDQIEKISLTPQQETLKKIIDIIGKQKWYNSTLTDWENPFESLKKLFSNKECVKEVIKAYHSYAEKLIEYIKWQQQILIKHQLMKSFDLEQQKTLFSNLPKISIESNVNDLKKIIEFTTDLRKIKNQNQEQLNQVNFEPSSTVDQSKAFYNYNPFEDYNSDI
jgi:hypothetical protein